MQDTLFPDFNAYLVNIEEFEGPLDLLLHLIKKNEVDIYNIPIAAITKQYLEYLELLKELNLDVAGEFLVMAATLLQIKSRMLLPLNPEDEESEEIEDPRAELVRRLLEYQRYREAATTLSMRDLLGRDVFARKFPAPDRVTEVDEEPADVELFELIEAFQRVLKRSPVPLFHDVEADGISIADRIAQVLDLVREGGGSVSFDKLFEEGATRELLIVTFLSVLELCRIKLIRITQLTSLGTIWMVYAGEPDVREAS